MCTGCSSPIPEKRQSVAIQRQSAIAAAAIGQFMLILMVQALTPASPTGRQSGATEGA